MKELRTQRERNCWSVIHNLKNGSLSGKQLADMLDVKPVEIRSIIQTIRENNHRFFNPSNKLYIVASIKGYELTGNIINLGAYKKHLQKTIKSKQKQLGEINIAIENGKDK